jgi:hypothetical protein
MPLSHQQGYQFHLIYNTRKRGGVKRMRLVGAAATAQLLAYRNRGNNAV